MTDVSRRTFFKGAALGAVSLSTVGVLAACAKETAPAAETPQAPAANVLSPTTMPTADTGSNFEAIPDSKTVVGSTYENLLTAIEGETGATTKYQAYAKVAEKEGFDQIARLFKCTADAEKIHIELEYKLAQQIDPDTKKPEPPTVEEHSSNINLIFGANGEIYETTDMYPSFIKAAQKEGNNDAVQVFTRAKLAEAYHAERYLDAYNTIDTPSDDSYYLCPICGYIHKGENFTACPICLAPKSSFTAY
ncbi:MAG: rubrerythrin family protein [Raoultibacter sp.]